MKIGVRLAIAFVMATMYSAPTHADDNFVQMNKRPSVTVLPLVALLANPDKYNGKEVQTYGFLCYSHHNAVLYLSSNDACNFGQLNGIAVDESKSGCAVYPGSTLVQTTRRLNRLGDCDFRYVELEGVFLSKGMLFPMRCPAGMITAREVVYQSKKLKFQR